MAVERPYCQKAEVKYRGIHMWVSRHLPANLCERCGSDSNLHHANVSGRYLRDLSDWKILCAMCHSEFDGRTKVPHSADSRIRELRLTGHTFAVIADQFGVTRKAISKRYYGH